MIFSIIISFLLCTTPAEEQLTFANHLFEEGDYYRAITEYKRLLFISSNPSEQRFARQRILSAFKRAGRLEEASAYLDNFTNDQFRYMEKAKLHLLMNDTGQARQYLKLIESDTVHILLGWSYMMDGDWENSQKAFQRIPDDSPLSATANSLVTSAEEAEHTIPRKSPVLSGLLSALIPGAGRFYTERPGDGLFSFLTVAIPAIATYYYWHEERERATVIAASFTAVFYLGDLYGAVMSAHQYNDYQKSRYTEKVNGNLLIKEHYLK